MSDRRTLTLAGLSFDIPTGWSTLTHGEAFAFAPARAEANQAFLALPVSRDPAEALGAALERLVGTRLSGQTIEAVEPGEPVSIELAEGLVAIATGRRSVTASGRLWSLDVLIEAGDAALYLSAFANDEATFNALVGGRFRRVLSSVHKVGCSDGRAPRGLPAL
jgi:hypothetical protein